MKCPSCKTSEMYIKGIESDGHNYIRVYGCVCGHCNVIETFSLYKDREDRTKRNKLTGRIRGQREITCPICGKTVPGYFNANRKYCSDVCQKIAHYKQCYERKGLVYQPEK